MIELRVSQNPLIDSEERMSFLKGVFFFYTITFIPSILLILFWKEDPKNSFTVKYLIAVIICSITFLALSFTLSFSKIIARKKPINYILYAASLMFLAITNRAVAVSVAVSSVFLSQSSVFVSKVCLCLCV